MTEHDNKYCPLWKECEQFGPNSYVCTEAEGYYYKGKPKCYRTKLLV